MQLQMCNVWWPADAHEEAHRGEGFQVQKMQQSLQTKENPLKTFQNSHNLRLDYDSDFEIHILQLLICSQWK